MTLQRLPTRPLTEAEIVSHLTRQLGKVWPRAKWGLEVPTHGRSRADVCVWSKGELITIEVKRTDWRRAIGQAALNCLVADYSYVALWEGFVSDQVLAEASRFGVGVLSVNCSELAVVLDAPRSQPSPLLWKKTHDGLRSRS